jgi:integrase
MAEATKFGHDQLGHILVDYLLEIPRFQRNFSWDEGNVREYLADLESARAKDVDYFMGTVVFARPDGQSGRRQIVDGQQRLATTAILYVAIRDELKRLGRLRQAEELEKRFLRGYVLAAAADLERLILNGDDVASFAKLLDGEPQQGATKIDDAYFVCLEHLRTAMGQRENWEALISISEQLEKRVQVLVAEASDLPEAYVIFETLNDRGADLTTADLLKNYLFSSSKDYFKFVEGKWLQLEAAFEKPEDLVKFIRYDFTSRHGPTTSRRLYRAIQGEIQGSPKRAKEYVQRLSDAQVVYLALRDPESDYWNSSDAPVKDALYAYRRFGFEASIPVLMAAFAKWQRRHADKLLVKMANWSIRAQMAGRLGGGVADEDFGSMAVSITTGEVHNQTGVRAGLNRIVPNDEEFIEAFKSYGDVAPSRAKYLLAMLEKAEDLRSGAAEKPLEWHGRSVTVEHILSQSSAKSNPTQALVVGRIGNMTLLEKKLNKDLASRAFDEKRATYRDSSFTLTAKLANKRTWTTRSIATRTKELAELACLAWPNT